MSRRRVPQFIIQHLTLIEIQCPVKRPSNGIVISASVLTLMPVKPRPPNACCFTPVSRTRWAKCTTAPRLWTGWSRSRSAASPSHPRPPPVSGRGWTATIPNTASTSSIRPVTSISRSKSSARCACSTARAWSIARSAACSRNRKPSGARPSNTACRGSRSSTRWTARARISSRSSTR